MTPAKPQQMSGQKDDPDDLIAELAKLMATDSKSGGGEPSRTPDVGFEPRSTSAPQTIRIPGMSEPVAAPSSPPSSKFDFGRPAANAPEPTSNWQDRLGSKPAPGPDPFAAPAARQEPSIGSGTWRPAIAPGEEPKAAPSAFDFDFGFNRERPEPAAPKPEPAAAARPAPAAPVPAAPPRAAQPAPPASVPVPQPPAPVRDPIAELIAAELNAEVRRAEAPAPEPAAPPPVPAPAPQRWVSNVAPAPMPAPAPDPVPARSEAQPPRPPQENDRFTTAPVFGLGNRPAGEPPAAPKVRLDPMDEIESLIGEAVRVELNMPQPPQPARAVEPMVRTSHGQPTPAVPPLSGQFAPRRTTSLRDAESAPGADDAILAAAAAAGSEVGRIDSSFADDRAVKPKKQSRRDTKLEQAPMRRGRSVRDERASGGAFKQLVVPMLAGVVLVAGGFGLYWYLGMGHNDGRAPILSADATPAKTIPAKPADTSAPHSVVMEQLSGDAPAASKETLVSRDQTAGPDGTQVASQQQGSSSTADNGLANRKVRTVTVRPDGTIVSSDDSVAGAAKLPVDRPNVPAVPGVAVANADNAPAITLGAPTTSAPAPTDDSNTLASVGLTPSPSSTAQPAVTADVASTPNDTTSASASAAAAAPDAEAPVPLPRPTRTERTSPATVAATDQFSTTRPNSPVNAVVRGNTAGAKPMDLIGNLASSSDAADTAPQPATTAPRTQPAAVASAASGSVAHVQLSSQPSAAGAQASASTLQKRFGSLFGGAQLQIVKVDLSKGTYYRVVLPTSSLQGAQQLCASIKAGGGACVASNG